jgi:hypothetical protein
MQEKQIVLKLTEAQKQLKGINLFKAVMMTEQVKECLDKINLTQIDSTGSSEIVKNSVQQLKKTIKEIGEVRKTHTGPLDAQKKAYMEVEKIIISPINEAIQLASTNVSAYAAEVRKKAAEAEKKLKSKEISKGAFITSATFMIDSIFKGYRSAIHKKELLILNKTYTDFLNPKEPKGKIFNLIEEFGRKEEVKVLYDYMVVAGKAVRLYIKDMSSKADATQELDRIKEALADKFELSLNDVGEKEASQISEINKSSNAVSKGTYSVIGYDVEDFSLLPAKFKVWQINDDAIKAYIKENKQKIADGQAKLEGVKFYVETKIRG